MRDSCGLPHRCLVFLLILVVILIWDNLTYNLRQLGIRLGFDFSSHKYSTLETFPTIRPTALLEPCWWDCSTLASDSTGLILTTILGLIAGIARLDNWLVRQLALVYVEIFRNTPLLLQLFFWYFAVS